MRPGGRRSIRLRGYDCTKPGAYFLTICTADRAPLFGEVFDGDMRLNGLGQIIENEWLRSETIRPEIVLDAFVVMPNHLHGIVFITSGREPAGGTSAPSAIAGILCGRVQIGGSPPRQSASGHTRAASVATRYLRTHHSGRAGAGEDPALHRVEPGALARGQGEVRAGDGWVTVGGSGGSPTR